MSLGRRWSVTSSTFAKLPMPLLHNTVLHSERLNVPGYVEIIYSGVRRVGYIFNLKNDLYYGVALCGRRFEAPSVWSVKEKLIPYIESMV